MKNLYVINFNIKAKKRHGREVLDKALKVQIENSLELNWKKEDIIILSDENWEHKGIKAKNIKLNNICPTGSKMFGIQYLLVNGEKDAIWAHDLDAWQNVEFEAPEFKDIGIARYSNSKFNGGSTFWKSSSIDIVHEIVGTIIGENSVKEEPILNRVLKSKKNKKRVTIINNTFNVGCSGFVKRLNRSDKPIKVCHFHPTNRIAWETHALDRNKIGEKSISDRLEKLLRNHYELQ